MDTKPIFDYINEINTMEHYSGSIPEYMSLIEKMGNGVIGGLHTLMMTEDGRNTIQYVFQSLLNSLKEMKSKYDINERLHCLEGESIPSIQLFLMSHATKTLDFIERNCNLEGRSNISLIETPTLPLQKEVKEDVKTTTQDEKTKSSNDDEWLSIDDVCRIFGLAKNSVKDRKWRIKNNFPSGNQKPKERCVFSRTEVEEWMKNRD